MTESGLAALSNELAGAVARAGRFVVAVNGRERISSSGIHWKPGAIVTAEHTIRRDEEITISLPDGSTVPATLAGRDAGTDIAVLKADCGNLPLAEAATGNALKPGHIVLAVGRGSETGVSAAMGVISGVAGAWRTWRGGMIERFVRLDVTLYPGSSGGAVVDTQGRVLGLATGGLSRVAGIAIPPETLERVAGELLVKGRVTRGYLGVGLQPVSLPDRLRSRLEVSGRSGVIVLSVEPGGPADQAGILVGDILVALDGKPVTDTDDVQVALGTDAVGRSLQASLVRGGERTEAAIEIRERPRREG